MKKNRVIVLVVLVIVIAAVLAVQFQSRRTQNSVLKEIRNYYNPARVPIQDVLLGKPLTVKLKVYDKNHNFLEERRIYVKNKDRVRMEIDTRDKESYVFFRNENMMWGSGDKFTIDYLYPEERLFSGLFFMLHDLASKQVQSFKKVQINGIPYFVITVTVPDSNLDKKEDIVFYINPDTYECRKIEFVLGGKKISELEIKETRPIQKDIKMLWGTMATHYKDGQKADEIMIETESFNIDVPLQDAIFETFQ
jgi:uncharacterized protein YxeA